MAETHTTSNDAALEILKRLEPVLTRIAADTAGLTTDVAGLKTDVATIKADVALLKTEVSGLTTGVANLQGRVSQLPTSWQMVTAIVATIIAVTGGTAAIVFAAMNYARAIR